MGQEMGQIAARFRLTGLRYPTCASLAKDRGLRILGRPGEPFDLNAVHPDEPWASVGGAARDVPMLCGSLIGEWRGAALGIYSENPARIALDSGCAPRLMVGRRRARWGVPENDARLAFGQVVDDARLLQRGQRIGARARSIPNAQ